MVSIFKKISILLLVASFSTMTGFSANAAEVEDDAAVLIDLKTERAVFRAIFGEPKLSASSIVIGCVDGIVTLQGSVENGADKQLAEQLAKSVEGVSEVRNWITTSS